MHNNAWSLIFFTLLSQFGAGLMFYLCILNFINQQAFQALPSGFSFKTPEFIVLIMLAFAVFFSFFHLGKPLHAANALNHLSSSWLSREIFVVLIFGCTVMLVFLLRIIKLESEWMIPAALMLSAIMGLLLVAMISKVYLIETIPSWNSWHTPIGFFLALLILGGSALILIYLNNTTTPESIAASAKNIAGFCWILAGLLLVEILITVMFQSNLAKDSPAGIEQISFTSGKFYTLHLIRIFIQLIAFILLIYFSLRLPGFSNSQYTFVKFFSMIIALIIIEEIIGRYQFYASYFRIGV